MKNKLHKLANGIEPACELSKEELKKRHKEKTDPMYMWLDGPLGDGLRWAHLSKLKETAKSAVKGSPEEAKAIKEYNDALTQFKSKKTAK